MLKLSYKAFLNDINANVMLFKGAKSLKTLILLKYIHLWHTLLTRIITLSVYILEKAADASASSAVRLMEFFLTQILFLFFLDPCIFNVFEKKEEFKDRLTFRKQYIVYITLDFLFLLFLNNLKFQNVFLTFS